MANWLALSHSWRAATPSIWRRSAFAILPRVLRLRAITLFRIASMTKPIPAAAATIRVEEARIALDDPLDRWLPEMKDRRVLRELASPLDGTVPTLPNT